jgi:RNA polymerase sigma factor (sigma-70 family)
MQTNPSSALLAAIERNRKRLWFHCYRMTGSRTDAEDLSQEAIARAIEREHSLADHANLDGWLARVATTVCLDHHRRERVRRRVTELVDPLDLAELAAGEARGSSPEAATLLRDDVRFAVMVALQHLSSRQRAALLLHDVCDHPIEVVAAALDTNANAAKALLHRARSALVEARRRTDVDPLADRAVVDRLAHAIETRSVEAFTALLDEDVWGIFDGGGIVQAASKPTYGIRTVSRQFANANRRQPLRVTAHVRLLNGEPAVAVRVPDLDGAIIASLHIETRAAHIAALRVIRDPRKLSHIGKAAA